MGLVTIDLSKFKRVKQTLEDECIACCLESVLYYYGYEDKSKTDFYSILKPKYALNFKGVIDNIAPLYPKLNFKFKNHNNDIKQLLNYIKSRINHKIPIITAIKSDYHHKNLFQRKILCKLLNVLDIINPVAGTISSHIITVIGYNSENIIFYEQGKQEFISLNYTNLVFETIIQDGRYDTLVIFDK